MVFNLHDEFELLKNDVIIFLPKLVISILIFILFMVIANYYKNYFLDENINSEETISKKSKSLILHQLIMIVYYLILTAGILFFLINLGVNIALIISILGIFGLAVGLAFQSSLSNIIAGIIISLSDLYDINDTIKINAIFSENYTSGKVVDFNLYYTTLFDSKSKTIINVPNSLIQNNVLKNINNN
jgi:small conductance mechanosensitive channel